MTKRYTAIQAHLEETATEYLLHITPAVNRELDFVLSVPKPESESIQARAHELVTYLSTIYSPDFVDTFIENIQDPQSYFIGTDQPTLNRNKLRRDAHEFAKAQGMDTSGGDIRPRHHRI